MMQPYQKIQISALNFDTNKWGMTEWILTTKGLLEST